MSIENSLDYTKPIAAWCREGKFILLLIPVMISFPQDLTPTFMSSPVQQQSGIPPIQEPLI